MHRRLSSLVKSGSSSQIFTHNEEPDNGLDTESKAPTLAARDEALPIPSLKVKRVDHYYSRWSRGWKYRNMNSNITVETIPVLHTGSNDPWKDYAFVIVRKLSQQGTQEPTFKIVIKSEYLLKACKDVIISWPGVSWNSDPLELEPDMFLTFIPEFEKYRQAIAEKKQKSTLDTHLYSSVSLLLSSLSADYRATLAKIQKLVSHSEITFDLLYAILVPRTIFVTKCAITGNPRLFKLVTVQRTSFGGKGVYQLKFESVDLVDRTAGMTTVGVGRVETLMLIKHFKGTVKIQSLDAYPIIYHSQETKLRESVLKQGKKWVSLIGVHHRQYDGVAAVRSSAESKVVKHNVKGRIMVDRATFRRLNPNHNVPTPLTNHQSENPDDIDPPYYNSDGRIMHQPIPPAISTTPGAYANGLIVDSNDAEADVENLELTDEDLLLASTVVFGFSLSDKTWLEFGVEKIEEIEWNNDAFENLVLPPGRKQLLQSLVEAHHRGLGFDDFIKGKGHGLVINLYGPPGVGKTFSAEATSEHVRKPLYLIGGGDLGTKGSDIDAALERIFDVATAWKAIVLIDEADVFLEQRSMHELERNAMVAVFLRHVEYYRGILFLTTNRVQAFDEAFLSRIHVALHFHELSQSSKEQVWTAFIRKLGIPASEISASQIAELARRGVNGRQIKNAARTAQSLAVGRGEHVGYTHFVETLDALEGFQREFEGLRKMGDGV